MHIIQLESSSGVCVYISNLLLRLMSLTRSPEVDKGRVSLC